MDKKMRQHFLLIAFGVILYACLMNLEHVFHTLENVGQIFLPVISGLILSFVLNVPLNGFDKLYTKLFDKLSLKPKESLILTLSLLSTFGAILLVFVLIVTMVVPELISSIKSVVWVVQHKIPQWIALLAEHNIDTTWLNEQLTFLNFNQIDFEQILKNVLTGAGSVLNSALGVASSTINVFVTVGFTIVISIYVLLGKKTLGRQCKKLLYAHTKIDIADKICYVAGLINQTYSKFLSGQCIEAIILGFLIYLSFLLFKIPYASLIGVLTGVLSFIPYIGAFSACFIGAILVLMINPLQALISIVVYQVVQFIENQFIYPQVVGGSVGLSPLWTLVAVLIGGNLFGILGMIFFIPLTAVFYQLLREFTNRRIEQKQLGDKIKE
ncbi:MAG: AI-2E family transporter [Eubacteriales bacterium]|nr:AI-2E family transporter [Eubacteriales bacterium]